MYFTKFIVFLQKKEGEGLAPLSQHVILRGLLVDPGSGLLELKSYVKSTILG